MKNKKPVKKTVTKGFFWHVHHSELLLEWSDDIGERIAYVKREKPADEVETRLRLMKPVRGPLPGKITEAQDALNKAQEAKCKAQDAYGKAQGGYLKDWEDRHKAQDAFNKAQEACDKARRAWDRAWKARNKAWDARDKAIEDNSHAIEALHRRECPRCPWNGRTIFPDKP
jgi:tetratricopeptide (TPR) repeat protein